MFNKEELINERSMSGFPLSIGTGLALESLFNPVSEVIDESRVVPKIENPSKYDNLFINVETLVRNMISSVESKNLQLIGSKGFLKALEEEIAFLKDFSKQQGMRIDFYYNTYEWYRKQYEKTMRRPTTELQHTKDIITKYCLKNIIVTDPSIRRYTQQLHLDRGLRTLLMTHFPVDLLSRGNFRALDLLESHTGKVKTEREYNTKYWKIPREDMSFLPFWEKLLVVFGDDEMFSPAPIHKRIDMYKTLKDLGVDPLSSEVVAIKL